MESSLQNPLERLQLNLRRLTALQQETETLLHDCAATLKRCAFADSCERELVLGRMVLHVFPQPRPDSKDMTLCFQPSLSCQRGFEVRIWEPPNAVGLGLLKPGHRSAEPGHLLPFGGGRQELRSMLVPQYGLMVAELLNSNGLIARK